MLVTELCRRGDQIWGKTSGQECLLPAVGQCLKWLRVWSYAVSVLGEFMHPCEDDIVCKCTTEENKVPYFNAPVYLENKEQIGKVDEIFGQLRDFVSFLIG